MISRTTIFLAIETMMKIEKIMSFLVEAGYNPDRLQHPKPMRLSRQAQTENRRCER